MAFAKNIISSMRSGGDHHYHFSQGRWCTSCDSLEQSSSAGAFVDPLLDAESIVGNSEEPNPIYNSFMVAEPAVQDPGSNTQVTTSTSSRTLSTWPTQYSHTRTCAVSDGGGVDNSSCGGSGLNSRNSKVMTTRWRQQRRSIYQAFDISDNEKAVIKEGETQDAWDRWYAGEEALGQYGGEEGQGEKDEEGRDEGMSGQVTTIRGTQWTLQDNGRWRRIDELEEQQEQNEAEEEHYDKRGEDRLQELELRINMVSIHADRLNTRMRARITNVENRNTKVEMSITEIRNMVKQMLADPTAPYAQVGPTECQGSAP